MKTIEMGETRRPVEMLLVEDNPGDVGLTQEALKHFPLPFRLSVVEDGEQALAFLRREGVYVHAPQPDLVILDLLLPKRDGYEVLAEVKQDPALRFVPVLVSLSLKVERAILQQRGLHAEGYLFKPPDLRQLLRALRHVKPTVVRPGLP